MPASFVPALNNASGPARDNTGFDIDAQPDPWLMVPLGRFNDVDLQWSSGLSLQLRNTQIARVETFALAGRTRVRLQGLQVGETALEVLEPGRRSAVARLDISVLPNKTVPISFQFVSDAAGNNTSRMGGTHMVFHFGRGQMTVRTSPLNARSMAEFARQCMKDLNDIFPPQTNVGFVLRNFGQAHINRDLGSHMQDSFDLRRRLRLLRDPNARVNVFFVWDIVVPGHHAVGLATTPLSDNICLVDDETPNVGQTVAHEVGHILLRPLRFHHLIGTASTHMLMYQSTAHGRFIPKQQAIHMNRQA